MAVSSTELGVKRGGPRLAEELEGFSLDTLILLHL